LHTAQVQRRKTEQQPAHNIPVEVLVPHQTHHPAASATALTCKDTTAKVGEVPLVPVNALANFLSPFLAFCEVGV
jgi:hypothetical protein